MLGLVIALVGFSFGSTFLKLAQINGMPSSVIISGRLLLCSLVFTPIILARYRDEIAHLHVSDYLRCAVGGTLLAIHLILIVDSLRFTSVLFNQLLVNTSPIWVALLEVVLLKVTLARKVWIGLGIAFLGSVCILLLSVLEGRLTEGSNATLGNFMAFIGAVFGAGYIITGKSTRKKVTIIPYLWIMYGVGGVIAFSYNIVTATPMTGYTDITWLWLVMVTIFPTLLGHTFFNYALGALSATVVTLSGQIVTFTASLIAFFIFNQQPTLPSLIASLILIGGVVISVLGQREMNAREAALTLQEPSFSP